MILDNGTSKVDFGTKTKNVMEGGSDQFGEISPCREAGAPSGFASSRSICTEFLYVPTSHHSVIRLIAEGTARSKFGSCTASVSDIDQFTGPKMATWYIRCIQAEPKQTKKLGQLKDRLLQKLSVSCWYHNRP